MTRRALKESKESSVTLVSNLSTYILDSCISEEGASSLVYKGHDAADNHRPVIVKELYPEGVDRNEDGSLVGISEEEKEGFKLQSKLLAAIRYDEETDTLSDYFTGSEIIEENNTIYLIFEANAKDTFDKIMENIGRIEGNLREENIKELIRRVELTKRIIEVISKIHERGYVHCD